MNTVNLLLGNLIAKAKDIFSSGDKKFAIQILEGVLHIDSKNYKALLELGKIYQDRKKFSKAVSCYENILGNNKFDYSATLGLIYAYIGELKFEKGKTIIENYLKQNPSEESFNKLLVYIDDLQKEMNGNTSFYYLPGNKIEVHSINEINILESQFWTKNQKENHQGRLLDNLVKQIYYNVPFWRKEMKRRDLTPKNIQTFDDLKKLPVIDKDIMMVNKNDFIAENADKLIYHKGNTGGSTGHPFNYLISKEQGEAISLTQKRGWYWAGKTDMNDKMLTIAGGGLGDYGGKKIELFGITDKIATKVYSEIVEYNPLFYRGLPYLMDLLCKYFEKLNLNTDVLKAKASFLTSEVLLDAQRKRISKILGAVYDTYGVNDGGSNAMECEKHSGFHVSDEIFYLETLDTNNQRVGYNNEGIITTTHFYNLAMPWVRYKSGDYATILDTPCSCGRTLPLITNLKGRVTDTLVTPNASFNGTELSNMINQLPMKAYQFIQEKEDFIRVKVVKENEFTANDEEFIRNKIVGVDSSVEVKFDYVDDIPLTKSGKVKYVVNNIRNR